MTDKKVTRLRRARKARLKMHELEAVRLCVYRSSQHIYAQVISADGSKVLASASTLDKALRDGATGNIDAAKKVGADPATLSSPLITSICDLVGVIIYFALAIAFLSDMIPG